VSEKEGKTEKERKKEIEGRGGWVNERKRKRKKWVKRDCDENRWSVKEKEGKTEREREREKGAERKRAERGKERERERERLEWFLCRHFTFLYWKVKLEQLRCDFFSILNRIKLFFFAIGPLAK
jgi:hypothetical protein